jgi:hypothetical protein
LNEYDGDIWHYKQIQNAINFMMSNDFNSDEMTASRKRKIKASDKFRNENFAEIFPELKELI